MSTCYTCGKISCIALVETLVTGSSFFEDHIKLLRGEVIIEEIDWVNFITVFMYFIMAMRAG